jgi:hypothetical protein
MFAARLDGRGWVAAVFEIKCRPKTDGKTYTLC